MSVRVSFRGSFLRPGHRLLGSREALAYINKLCHIETEAKQAGIVYSLVDTCKAVGKDPREWMVEDVLVRIPGNENNRAVLRDLLPDRWTKQSN